jgi:hypothetical protein
VANLVDIARKTQAEAETWTSPVALTPTMLIYVDENTVRDGQEDITRRVSRPIGEVNDDEQLEGGMRVRVRRII